MPQTSVTNTVAHFMALNVVVDAYGYGYACTAVLLQL